MTHTTVEAGPHGPALPDTDDQALLAALRNLWPILSPAGRRTATDIAKGIGDGPTHP